MSDRLPEPLGWPGPSSEPLNPCARCMLRLSVTDAEILAKEFYPEFSVEDLINLPNYSIYLKLMIEGRVSKPFSAKTISEVRSNGP